MHLKAVLSRNPQTPQSLYATLSSSWTCGIAGQTPILELVPAGPNGQKKIHLVFLTLFICIETKPVTAADPVKQRINLRLIPVPGAIGDDDDDNEGLSDADKARNEESENILNESGHVVGSKILEALALGPQVPSTSKKSLPKGAESSLQPKKKPKEEKVSASSTSKNEPAAPKSSLVRVAAPRSAARAVMQRKQKNDFTPGSGVLDFSDLSPKGTEKLFADILLDRGHHWNIAFVPIEVFIVRSVCSIIIMTQILFSGFCFTQHQNMCG